MEQGSGVQLLDKAVAILRAVGSEPLPLAGLVAATGIPRPTAHRLAVAMESHGLLGRDSDGRFTIGPLPAALSQSASDPLLRAADAVLRQLRDQSGESAQLYRRQGELRVCVAAAERASGLRDSVPVGAQLPMTAGSAAQVLLAWQPVEEVFDLLDRASFDAATLAEVRRQGWAASVAEREAGVGSVSAPVRSPSGAVVAAISVSGPLERLGESPGQRFGRLVIGAAEQLSLMAGR